MTVYDTLGSDSESGVRVPKLEALWDDGADCDADEPGFALFKGGIVAPGFVLDEHPMRSNIVVAEMTLDLITPTRLCRMSYLPLEWLKLCVDGP
ncbi:hypothetical protein ATCC27039_00510 [Actinomyces naeslundii]|nr:hypothetical protein ATCC27039_00510 [Actinomyces naeslundii]